MKKAIALILCIGFCLGLLAGCGSANQKEESTVASTQASTAESTAPAYVLSSNSEKATLRADKDFKTAIQITNTYPETPVLVFEDPAIASGEFVQWVGNKGALMITGLKKGETTLTIYGGAENGDVKTAKASLTVKVTVVDEPSK